MSGSLDIIKVKNIWLLHTCPYLGACSVVFKHFWVSLAEYVISIYLKKLFYIDINKNIISYFNTWKLPFVILLPSFCKKTKHPLFLIHFEKQLEDKLWLVVGFGWSDGKTVVVRVVNLCLLRRSRCSRRIIVWYEFKSSQCHFEMSNSITPT